MYAEVEGLVTLLSFFCFFVAVADARPQVHGYLCRCVGLSF